METVLLAEDCTRLPRSWMKTIRGIFLTTQGHSGTAVPKDCELNERERDRRYGLSFFARSGVLWIFHFVYYDVVYSTVPFSVGRNPRDSSPGRRGERASIVA